MAKARSIPTRLFWDPAFSDLDGETQSVFIGLTLEADDYGRGLCHTGNLSRALNKRASIITEALDRLEATGLITRYQVDTHTCYQHQKWDEWQRLDKRTPSQYPPPPGQENLEEAGQSTPTEAPGISRDFPGKVPLEEEGEEEENKNRKRTEAEEIRRLAKVIPLPTSHSGGGGEAVLDEKRVGSITSQVATILQLPVSPALRRVVADFLGYSNLSLPGEADAAREYIDNPQRNHRGKAMTPAFYRSWLKRERDQAKASTGTDGKSGRETVPRTPTNQTSNARTSAPGKAGQSLMGLANQYQDRPSSPTERTIYHET